ncbi:MAG: hypothetical protein Q9190_007782 [Brigantiaea leucoxantha]
MVVNYSKWDALELSDDSDIEVHPNVDKRSFIRAKQNQIHQQRFERRQQIATLKYERIINDGLLQRIERLLETLRNHEAKVLGSSRGTVGKKESEDAEDVEEEVMMQALIDCTTVGNDIPPSPPENVHTQEKGLKYSSMMASLVDQVKEEASKKQKTGGEKQDTGTWVQKYIQGVEGHKSKVKGLQMDLEKKLEELEKEESKKITSDSIHTGFDRSSVAKEKEKEKPKAKESKTVEVLNPGALGDKGAEGQSSRAEGDANDDQGKSQEDDDDEEDIKATELGKRFAKIRIGEYKQCLQFISENRDVVKERETDGLLVEAFNAQMEGKSDYARQCVHQALLLQYCRSLGKDGVGLFFKR